MQVQRKGFSKVWLKKWIKSRIRCLNCAVEAECVNLF